MARTVSDTRPPLARIASYGVGAGGLTTSEFQPPTARWREKKNKSIFEGRE